MDSTLCPNPVPFPQSFLNFILYLCRPVYHNSSVFFLLNRPCNSALYCIFMAMNVVCAEVIYHLNYFYSLQASLSASNKASFPSHLYDGARGIFLKVEWPFHILVLETFHGLPLPLDGTSFMDMWHVQLHRVLLLEGPHIWFNALLYYLRILIVFEQRALYFLFCIRPHKL